MYLAAGCATVAEVRKRGDDFWGEFEFYLSDLVVGCVLDCVLVGLLAPAAVIGAKPKSKPSGKHHALLSACWLFVITSFPHNLLPTRLAVRHASLQGALPERMWQESTSMLPDLVHTGACSQHGRPRGSGVALGPCHEQVEIIQSTVTIYPVIMLHGSSQTAEFFTTAAFFSASTAPMPCH